MRLAARALAPALLYAAVALAQPAPPDPLDARLRELETELRCLVCQNQTLADSDAPLAVDLRNQIREMAKAGRSDDDIRAYLLERYGDFVLYLPRFTRVTWLLWLGPILLLVVALIVGARVVRNRRRAAIAEVPAPASEAAARDLLS